jgi:hypothetical protein
MLAGNFPHKNIVRENGERPRRWESGSKAIVERRLLRGMIALRMRLHDESGCERIAHSVFRTGNRSKCLRFAIEAAARQDWRTKLISGKSPEAMQQKPS